MVDLLVICFCWIHFIFIPSEHIICESLTSRPPNLVLLISHAKSRHKRESKNKKQETKRFSTFAVYRLRHSETKKKHCLIRESSFQRNICETANQQSISGHMVVYMACIMRCGWLTFRRCFVNRALSRNRSLRDAKPARHLFVWFAKHCLAEHFL